MTMQLSDEGTMDTVLRCSECGEEFRYNFDGAGGDPNVEPTEQEAEQAYDAFVDWAIEDATGEHMCIETPSEAHTEVTADSYFDAARGLYWYCANYHGGQDSELYSIMSARLDYHPAMAERGPDFEDGSGEFYRELVGKGWDATEMLAAIDKAYAATHG